VLLLAFRPQVKHPVLVKPQEKRLEPLHLLVMLLETPLACLLLRLLLQSLLALRRDCILNMH
jgi:hypothetical protein